MNRTPIFVFAWIAFAALGFAREPVRLAISGDPAFAVEADLITAELSKVPDVVLLERQQILKIANEQALHATGAADGIKLGRMLGADGLLILSRTEIDGRALLAARLVAVQPGVVIDEWTSTPHEAAEGHELAVVFSRRITPLLPKLRVSKEDAVPVSVAGLFAAVDSPELRKIERELTWLLVHRLTQEPTIFVLERTRMEDLVLEKELAAAEPEPFLSGAVIVEGKLEERAGRLDLAVGLRRPGEKKVGQANVTGAANDLPAFAEKIVSAILDGLKMKPTVQRWNLADEAAFYADQAEWAMNHRLIDLCIASAESAWALGRRDVDLARLRVIAYSLAAYPIWPEILGDFAPRSGSNVRSFSGWEIVAKDQTRSLTAAIRALEICADCLPEKLAPSRRAGREFRPVAAQALWFTSQMIGAHFVSGHYQAHAAQLSSLRSLARKVHAELSKPPEPRAAYDPDEFRGRKDSHTIQAAAAYAPFWFETNEEVIACYRQHLKPVRIGERGDEAIMIIYSMDHGSNPLSPLVPWVVAWNPAENRARQQDMLLRLKHLTESGDFDDQAVGWASLQWLVLQAEKAKSTENDLRWPQDYAAVLAGKPTDELPKNLVKNGVLEFLWNWREKIIGSCQSTAVFSILGQALAEADHDFQLRYLRYMLDEGRHINWYLHSPIVNKLKLTEEESIEFQQFCAAAREKAQARGNFDGKENYLLYLSDALETLVKSNPPPKPAQVRTKKPTPAPQASTPPLVVTRYWYPSASADAPKMPSGIAFNRISGGGVTVSYADGKLWFVPDCHEPAMFLGSIALDSFRTEYHPMPPPHPHWPSSYEPPFITKDAVYLLNGGYSKKWDRHNDRWSSLELPDYPYSGRILGDSLYLPFTFGSQYLGINLIHMSSAGSGILRLDLRDDKTKFLASSRRRPAETRLDACEPYIPMAVFSDTGGKVSAAIQFPVTGERKIFRTTTGGDWQEVMDLPNTKIGQVHFSYTKDGVLAYMHPRGSPDEFFQCVFFGEAGVPGEVLLSISKPSDPPSAILPGKPRWDLPPEMNHGLFFWQTAFNYSDGSLYQLNMLKDFLIEDEYKEKDAPTPDLKLVVYTSDSRAPIIIPLRFQLSESDKAKIIADQTASHAVAGLSKPYAVKKVEIVSGMKVVPEGIVFFGGEGIGFWLLPAKELEARLQESRK